MSIFIRPGFWVKIKNRDKVKGALDLRKYVRDTLKAINVGYYDSCCPGDGTALPVVFNSVTGKTTYFNGTAYVTPGSVVQTLTGAGVVSLSNPSTLLVTAGAVAITLAAGVDGQRKFIKMKTYGGTATLTPTLLQGGTTLAFTAVNQFVELYFLDGKWNIIANSGATLA